MKRCIGVQWKQCNDCDYKAKQNSDLDRHIKSHLNIGVMEWKQSPECDYKVKTNSEIKMHKSNVHVQWVA